MKISYSTDEKAEKMSKVPKSICTLIEKIKQLLRCSICHDTFRDVSRTTCGHYFCGPCISQVIEEKPKGKRSATCPLCKKNIIKRSVNAEATLEIMMKEVTNLCEALKYFNDPEVASPASGSASSLRSETATDFESEMDCSTVKGSQSLEIAVKGSPVSPLKCECSFKKEKQSESWGESTFEPEKKKARLGGYFLKPQSDDQPLVQSPGQVSIKEPLPAIDSLEAPAENKKPQDTSTPASHSRQPLFNFNASPIRLPENGGLGDDTECLKFVETLPLLSYKAISGQHIDGQNRDLNCTLVSSAHPEVAPLFSAADQTAKSPSQCILKEMGSQTDSVEIESKSKLIQTNPEIDLYSRLASLTRSLCISNGVEGLLSFEGIGRIHVKLSKPESYRSLETVDKGVGTADPPCLPDGLGSIQLQDNVCLSEPNGQTWQSKESTQMIANSSGINVGSESHLSLGDINVSPDASQVPGHRGNDTADHLLTHYYTANALASNDTLSLPLVDHVVEEPV